MSWAEPNYSKSVVNKAGDFFRKEGTMSEENALKVFDNWRAAHSYPMQIFYVRLRRTSKAVDNNSLVARRLKRASSVIAKLNRRYDGRPPTMQLSQMQDIGGVRAILSNVALVQKLTLEKYEKSSMKHKLVKKDDYIVKPKSDGYRSIHLIYSYKSDKANKQKYDGLLVEVQIRSKLQHLWATAVETVGFFTRQAIKSNEGSPEWADFFRLVGSAFAKIENCPPVPNTPTDIQELYGLI
ncbi:MAG TPA: RelA/SpoT domain-containing protein, partial [Candidatus Nitrosotalea sp.]|nr:RelA/SpoT domain-containing protein [Candidatus Nitrosotalea sp.]